MSTDPRTYYDRFSTSYEQRRGYGYHALIDELEAATVPAEPSLRVMEAGCGTGLVLERLRASGARLFGTDLSSGMLSLARGRGHAVAQGTLERLPFVDEAFDVAYSFKVLAHVPEIRQAVSEMARVVRPGGTLVLEFYNKGSLRGLRWRIKQIFGGERTADQQREAQVFTRYDSLADIMSYLPPNVRLEAVRGAIVFTPAAFVFGVAGLRVVLTRLERWAAGSRLARRAGFLILVLRRV